MSLLLALVLAPVAAATDDPPPSGALTGWGPVPIPDEASRREGTLHLWGQLQTWVTVFDQDVDPQADPATYGDPEADPGFTVARARLGVDGFLPMGGVGGASSVDYSLSMGIASPYDALSPADPDVQFLDAFGRWAVPSSLGVTSLALGIQRVPFSREAMISSADLVFEERAVGTNWLAPGRDAGVAASQSVSLSEDPSGNQLLLRLGGFNGNGDVYGDSDPGLLGVARLELIVGEAYRTWGRDPALGIGVSGLVDADSATRTTSLEADLLARYGLVTLLGEVISSGITPTATDVADPAVAATTQRLGWLGQASLWIPVGTTGTFEENGPGLNVDPPRGLEVSVRYATFDDAVALQNNGDVAILHAGTTLRNLLPRVDVGLGYIHRAEATATPNDTIRLWTQIRPDAHLMRR